MTSSSLSVGNLDKADGILLSSSGFPFIKAYLGNDAAGEGSCDTGTWTDVVGIGAGRAIAPATRSAATGEKIVIFMAMLCSVSEQVLYSSRRL